MLNLGLLNALAVAFTFLILYGAVRLGVRHGMRDDDRDRRGRDDSMR